MKKILIFCLLLAYLSPFCQIKARKDTLVNNGLYEALYSFTNGQPVYVKYKLYKGGGDCNRKKEAFNFKRDSVIKKPTADNDDYEGTGYDKGHLANAEDFAFDCKKTEKTFRYYNCLPQTVDLNRGEWKKHEEKVRLLSQTDSLLIFCGGIINTRSKRIKEGSVLRIPVYCYKVVISLSTHKLLDCVIFNNNDEPEEKKIPLNELEYKTKFYFERITRFTIKQ